MFTWNKERQLKCGYIPNGEIVEVHFRIKWGNIDWAVYTLTKERWNETPIKTT